MSLSLLSPYLRRASPSHSARPPSPPRTHSRTFQGRVEGEEGEVGVCVFVLRPSKADQPLWWAAANPVAALGVTS